MVADVAVNSHACFVLGYSEFAPSLLMQSAFLGFVIGTMPLLWPERKPVRADERGRTKR